MSAAEAVPAFRAGDREAKIVVDGVTKYYETRTGRVHALGNFSMTVREGEFVCVLGPSGCGKTTLLWAMMGDERIARHNSREDPAGRETRDGAAT